MLTTNISAMISPEGERVALTKGLKARGNVEDWLGKVESSMFFALRRLMKASLIDYQESLRTDWMVRHPSQITLTVSQIMWARGVHAILDHPRAHSNLEKFEQKSISDLNDLAGVIRTDLDPVTRKVLIALITIDVHARDTVRNMVEHGVKKRLDIFFCTKTRPFARLASYYKTKLFDVIDSTDVHFNSGNNSKNFKTFSTKYTCYYKF